MWFHIQFVARLSPDTEVQIQGFYFHYLLEFHDYDIFTVPAVYRNSFVIFLWNSKDL